jgi:hypothetical protein
MTNVTFRFGISKLQYGVYAFLLCIFYKSAGIYDDRISRYLWCVNSAAKTILQEQSLQCLAINEIF